MVRLVVAMIFVNGLWNVLLGVLVLLSRYDQPDDAAVVEVSLLGAATILLGLLTVAAGSSIARGSRLARLLVTIYLAALVALHVFTIVTSDAWDWQSAVELLLEAAIIVVLWTPPGSHYFTVRAVQLPE